MKACRICGQEHTTSGCPGTVYPTVSTTKIIKKYLQDWPTGKEAQDVIDYLRNQLAAVQQRADRLQVLNDLKDQYISLLGGEIEGMAVLAYVHGWTSTNIEEGKRLREAIKAAQEVKG